jgi:NAD(P)-dependent dehydrogenase (short-subunit alcohol dehydrogenase family)
MESLLNSFPARSNVALIGASGGIGQAMLELLSADPRVARTLAFSRTETGKVFPGVEYGHIDLDDESTIAAAASSASCKDALDLVIVSSGILWSGDRLRPEKAMKELDPDALSRVFAVNTTGPALVAKHFLPKLRKGSKSLFGALSARVGSISDNRLGGWYAYRASKAALNMLLKTLSIEHARQWPDSVVVGLHPGTVATGLSQPYTSRTPAANLFTPAVSARHLLHVMDGLAPQDTGNVFAWDGKRVDP